MRRDRDGGGSRRVAKMAVTDIELLMVYLLQLPQLRAEAAAYLEPEMLDGPGERHLRILWGVVLDTVRAPGYGGDGPMPAFDLQVAVRAAIGAEPDRDALEVQLLQEPMEPGDWLGLIPAWLQARKDPGDYTEAKGRDLLRRLVAERSALRVLERALVDRETAPGDLSGLLTQATQAAERAAGLGVARQRPLAPPKRAAGAKLPARKEVEVWEPPDLAFVAQATGQFVPGEIYGLMGPMGQGKTQLVLQIATASAAMFQVRRAKGLEHRDVHYFHYELTELEVLQRIWARLATIPGDRMLYVDPELWDDDPFLTNANDPTGRREKYEEYLAADKGLKLADLKPEAQRLREEVELVRPYLQVHTMSGEAGFGGIDEVVAALTRRRAETGVTPGVVIIDYVKIAALRRLIGQGRDPEKSMRFGIQEFVDGALNRVAKRFNCCVWLVQQVAGKATKRASGSLIHHSEASESTMFAENLHYCGALGNRDKTTSIQALSHSKCRRTGLTGGYSLLKFDGRFGYFSDVSDRFTIQNDQIVDQALANRVASPGSGKGRPETSGVEVVADVAPAYLAEGATP